MSCQRKKEMGDARRLARQTGTEGAFVAWRFNVLIVLVFPRRSRAPQTQDCASPLSIVRAERMKAALINVFCGTN